MLQFFLGLCIGLCLPFAGLFVWFLVQAYKGKLWNA